MSSPQLAAYQFLPWVQRGLARALRAADEPGAALAARVALGVRLRVEGTADVTTTVRLYGPGDVTGLDPRQVVRTDPRPGTRAFEPGYMAQVQFARAELPWLFTPALAGTGGARLRPWLVLVAIRRQDGVTLANEGGPLPVLDIAPPARAAAELPDLEQSWAWAHAQVAGAAAGETPGGVLASAPERGSSRLVCPRRLEPGTAYVACVVPAFGAGVKAGLGDPVTAADEARLDPAWTAASVAAPLRLPVYHSWEFSTGAEGSFETLVRRLQPRPLDPSAARPPRLDVSAPGGGLPAFDPAAPGAVIELESALRVPGPDAPPPWPAATRVPFQTALERLVTSAPRDAITAPLYGQVQAGADALPPAAGELAWLRECNLDPRLRVAAAAGARVVQERQEQLMARAWEQAGAVRDANELLRRTQLARELGGVLMERHLERLAATELLAVTQPVHARVALAGTTVAGELRASRVPAAAVTGAMRRLASPQGAVARRARGGAGAPGRAVDVLRAADRLAVAPRLGAPAGIVTLPLAQLPARADPGPALSAESIQARLLARLRPADTVLAHARRRVDAPAETWSRPDPLAPVTTGPRFPEPMYDGLRDVEPALLLAGVQHVEPDSVALLETTPRVIEAYMLGLNHELGRELLWREFPADLTATAFAQFWDVRGQAGDPDELADIPPIAEWEDGRLGTHLRGGGGRLVLLVRGELLRRYPATTIFAARANADGTLDLASRRQPLFRATIAEDVALTGFALSEEAARGTDPPGPGWYFAFEQYPGEPRFGFDEVAGAGVPQTPDDLAWAHVPVTPSGHVDVDEPLLSASASLQAAWGRDAARIAQLTFQQPFRIAIHASRLLPPEEAP